MSFLNLSPAAFWLGLAALGAGLFALQRLRVRHREISVPTLLFWKEAVEDAPARVLVERFRHPLAYLLVLAIAALTWLGVANLGRRTPAEGRRYAVLIDGSAAMAAEGRLEAAIASATELAGELPLHRRRVVWCGAEPRTVLLPGEASALVAERLAGQPAEACPPSLETAARAFAAEAGEGTCVVLGDSAWRPGFLEAMGLAEQELGLELLRWPLETSGSPSVAGRSSNAGVAVLGLRPALSGNPAAVDVLVAASGPVEVSLDGQGLAPASTQDLAGQTTLRFLDVPASGGLLEAQTPGGDAISIDDRAARRLPVRRPLRVAVDPALGGVFDAVLAADPGLFLASTDADVVVRQDSGFEPGLPALQLVARESQAEPLLVVHDADVESAALLEGLVPRLGLDRVDAASLATALGVPLAVGASPGPVAQLSLWAELLDPSGADLASSRAFPALVSRGLRWLGGEAGFPSEVAAGRVLSQPLELVDDQGLRLAAFGTAAVPPLAGAWTDPAGAAQPVSLLASIGIDRAGDDSAENEASLESSSLSLGSLLILAVLALLALEWMLVRTGRMP